MRGVIHCVWLLVLIWEPFSNRFLLIFLEFAFPPILTLYQLIVSSILAHYLYSDFLTFCLLYLFDLLVTVVLTLVRTHTHTQLTDHGNNKFTLTVSAQLCMLLTTLHLCSLLNMQWCTLTSSVTHTHTHMLRHIVFEWHPWTSSVHTDYNKLALVQSLRFRILR